MGGRTALFGFTGLTFFVHWLVEHPGLDVSPTQGEWPHVLAFSAAILMLAFAVPLFARMVGQRLAIRASWVVAAGAVLASAANVVEDGLKVEWAFFVFVASTAIMLAGLLALTLLIVARSRGRGLALVPIGTLAALLFYVTAGGPVMLATWLLAGVFSLTSRRGEGPEVPLAPEV